MRKPEKKIELTEVKGKINFPVKESNSKNIIMGNDSPLPTQYPNAPNPYIVQEIIEGVIDISNNLINLATKIQETKQIKEHTKQVVAQANVIITQEIEATNRMKIELEKEQLILQNDLEKYRMDTNLAMKEREQIHELNLKAMDIDYAKFRDKINSYSNLLNSILQNYNNIEASMIDDPESMKLIISSKASLREDIFRVLSLISDL